MEVFKVPIGKVFNMNSSFNYSPIKVTVPRIFEAPKLSQRISPSIHIKQIKDSVLSEKAVTAIDSAAAIETVSAEGNKIPWVGIICFAGAVLVVLVCLNRKNRREDNK